jgi:hypothetical protein
MILRRFMQHMNDQNWLAVGLDLIVVVTGIFLGMQVTEWNESRKDRNLEEVYLNRLYSDVHANVQTISSIRQLHRSYFDQIIDVAAYLQEGVPDKVRHDALAAKRLGDGVLPAVTIRTGTWDELVSTGRLNILRDQELRENLQSMMSESKWAADQLDFFRQSSDGISVFLDKVRTVRINPDPKHSMKVYRNYEPFLGDQALINMLGNAAAQHFLVGSYRQGELDEAKMTLKTLACLLDKPECNAEEIK